MTATRREMVRRESDLVQVLELVSELCRHSIDVVEADRNEHHAFLARIADVMRAQVDAPAVAPFEKVLGGTVFGSPEEVDLGEIDRELPVRVPPAMATRPGVRR